MKLRAASLAALALVVSACTIMSGLHLDQAGETEPGGDGGAPAKDAGSSGASSGGDGGSCNLKHAPPKPAAQPAGTEIGFVVAMKNMVSQNTGPAFGIDLDNLCTCPGREACAVRNGVAHCDPEGTGLDNTGSATFRDLTQAAQLNLIEASNDRILNAQYGLLFKVDGWNQTDNDDVISVTVIRSRGITPTFTEKQSWPSSTITTAAKEAWVSGSTLVAVFDAIDVPFMDDSAAPTKMRTATLLAPLIKVGADPSLGQGILAGRANIDELIKGIGEEDGDGAGDGVCQSPLYGGFATRVCDQADLPTDPASDGTSAACDAFSFALSMTFVPATLGSTKSVTLPTERCDGITHPTCN